MSDERASDRGASTDAIDVIVVGGGPVGVATALLCTRRGLRTVLVERDHEVHDLPRAVVMDDEIQRVFQAAGVFDGLREITSPMLGAEFVDAAGERIIGIEITEDMEFANLHHPVVRYHQPQLEAFLRSCALEAGVELRLGVEMVDLDAGTGADGHGDGAWIDVRPLGSDAATEPERLHARWIVAADGASSPTRRTLGVPRDDQGFDQEWLVIDVELTTYDADQPDAAGLSRFTQQWCDPARPVTYVPGFGRLRRWEFQLLPGETREEITRPERVWELLAPWLTPAQGRLVRGVVYRFHATVAGTMRVGRVFLAGDAAHQMPPFLGQGLCSGVRDAANLAWKLDLVARGLANEAFLDTYDAERRPHAAALVAHAADTGRLIDALSGRGGEDGEDGSGPNLDDAYGGQRPFPHLTTGWLWGAHPMVGRQLPQPVVDGRPLDDLLGPTTVLLTAGGTELPDAVRDRWAALDARHLDLPAGVIHEFVLPVGAVAVVRPDRYVAGIATNDTELAELTDTLLEAIA